MSAPATAAPTGFLTLGETAARLAERMHWTQQKARFRLAGYVEERRLRMLIAERLERLDVHDGERPQFDFQQSTVTGAGGPTVMHLHIGEGQRITVTAAPGIRIVFDQDDIEHLLDELAPGPAPVAIMAQPPASIESAPRRGGRPPDRDWEAIKTQLRRRIYRYGLPKKSSVLVFEVLDLLCRDPPELRTIQRYVAKWWPEFEALWEDISGACEIQPASNDRPLVIPPVAP